jgi:hypothetical protein
MFLCAGTQRWQHWRLFNQRTVWAIFELPAWLANTGFPNLPIGSHLIIRLIEIVTKAAFD